MWLFFFCFFCTPPGFGVELIAQLPNGRLYGVRVRDAEVPRGARGGALEVDLGWLVPFWAGFVGDSLVFLSFC